MKLDDFQEIDAIPAAEWAKLAARDLYSTTAWLRCIAPFTGDLHALLDRDGAAGAVGYLYTKAHPPAPLRRPDKIIATRHAVLTGQECTEPLAETLLPSLVLGGQRLHDSALLLRDGEDAVAEFLSAASARAAELGARSVMYPYVSERDPVLAPALARAGYVPVPQGEASHLAVTFADMDEYLAARPARRRQRLRSEMRKLSAAGLRTRFVPLTHQIAEELAPFEAETWRRHGMPRELADSQRSLHGLADLGAGLADGQAIAGMAELDGKLLAFTASIHYRDDIFVRNYARLDSPSQLPVYFGLVYYAHIQYALDSGARCLYYGLAAEEAKRARGCSLVQQLGYLAPAAGGEFSAGVTRVLHTLSACR